MIDLINRYLFLHKFISIADFGTIQILERSAELDFHNKILYGPSYELQFSQQEADSKLFINWLDKQHHIDVAKAIDMLANFIQQFQTTIQSQGEYEWKGLGTFRSFNNGKLNFIPEVSFPVYPSIETERVIHKDTDHKLTVGEQERTKFEMQAILAASNKKTFTNWWIAAAILAAVSLGLLLLYNFNHPLLFKKQGNQQKIHVTDMPLLHEELQ